MSEAQLTAERDALAESGYFSRVLLTYGVGMSVVDYDLDELGEPNITRVEIARERLRQNRIWGGPNHDDQHSRQAWTAYKQRQIHKVEEAKRAADKARAREHAIQYHALCVAEREARERPSSRVHQPSA